MKKTQKYTSVVTNMVKIFINQRVSRSAAGLSYYLMLSVFPMLICLNAMLGHMFTNVDSVAAALDSILPNESLNIMMDYLKYITGNSSKSMLTGGIIAMATTSGAAFRSLHYTMADIHGEPRFRGFFMFLVSFLFSIAFLATIYFSVIVIFTGNWFLRFIDDHIIFINVNQAWTWLRFILMLFLLFVIIYGVYRITAPKEGERVLIPGAVAASVALVAVSIIFSWFIGLSTKYPLVYGSLASIIIMMVWLFICATIVIMGNVLNVCLKMEK